MIVTPIHTQKVVAGDKLEEILKTSLPHIVEQSVIVITSKIVSICEGSVAPLTANKETLITKQAQKIFVNKKAPQEVQTILTISNDIFTPWAGIDESNGNGLYILLPENPMKTAEEIWHFIKNEYGVREVGVIIVDSTFIPLRTGSVSVGMSWCGFEPIKNYIGTKDIFGKTMHYTTKSLVDGLSIAAAFTMGEGDEQQPLAVISDIPNITFVDRKPTVAEVASMHFPMEKDLFGPLIEAVKWEKGQSNSS